MNTLQQLLDGQLTGVTSLKLSEGLKYFPEEIFELADTLETLDLSGNQLSALHADLGKLRNLKILFCSDNLFTALPEVLSDCPLLDIVGFKSNRIEYIPPKSINTNLRLLILTNNQISVLPAEIGNCWNMQKLMLAGNRLTTLPVELSRCSNLALLRIAANRLTQLPGWLLAMPNLAWLAFSGNRFNGHRKTHSFAAINWNELKIERVLGEGASGIIYKANQRNATGERQVAVKVFKGAVTSDGLPDDELNACIEAGTHPGLVKIVGQIKAHPESKKGLVMELIPEHFYNLGGPPSLASCTRDVFKSGMLLDKGRVLKIGGTIASVALHLHSKGIMHGDLYAHNILIDDDGNTLFGDFGAACLYSKTDRKVAAALERLEVRAFGYLLDDLLTLCDETMPAVELAKLETVRDTCMLPDTWLRPSFQDINDEISKLL